MEASGDGDGSARMWMIYTAVAADLLGDGLMIGAGSSVGSGVGVTVAIGRVLADIPEGAATVLTLRGNQVPRCRRMLISASFVLLALIGAVISYLALRGRPEAWQLAALVGTAGLFTVAAFEDLISEAHEAEDSRTSALMLLGGFASLTLVSAGVG